MLVVRHPQDFWSGLLFAATGAAAAWLGQEYAFGALTRMGPGFLPTVLAWALMGLGGILVARSFVIKGASIAPTSWRPQILIIFSIIVFALLIERVGLVPTVLVVTIVAALASVEMRWRETIILSVGMSIASLVLFIWLLGQSMRPWTWSF